MATAEFAVALPAVLLVLAVGLTGVRAGLASVQCADAARLAARSLARGDSPAHAQGLAQAAAPRGASIALSSGGATVQVSCAAQVGPIGGLSVAVSGSATAALEQQGGADVGP